MELIDIVSKGVADAVLWSCLVEERKPLTLEGRPLPWHRPGIEPGPQQWQARVLPLCYQKIWNKTLVFIIFNVYGQTNELRGFYTVCHSVTSVCIFWKYWSKVNHINCSKLKIIVAIFGVQLLCMFTVTFPCKYQNILKACKTCISTIQIHLKHLTAKV